MFRQWLSGFYRKNKKKIFNIAKLFGLLILIGIALSSSLKMNSEENNEAKNVTVYSPSKTVISGEDVDKETYKREEDLIKTFTNYCNNKQIEEAYRLLTDECKEKMYPDIEKFTNNYYNIIFTKNREVNLQSWVSSNNCNTYRVNFIEDIMATGNYDNVEKLQDYITIVTEDNVQKLNINSYVKSEEINKTTETDELEITVKSADIYMDSIKYYLEVTNLSGNDILLDTLTNKNIKLVGTNEVKYALDYTNLFSSNLIIYKNSKNKKIELKFIKQYGSEIIGKSIEFNKTITNYDEYLRNKEDYNEFKQVSIKLY